MTTLQQTLHAPAPQSAPSASPSTDPTVGLVKLPLLEVGRSRRWRVPRGLERFAGVALLFAVWQIAASAGWLSPTVLAGPSTVVHVGWDMIKDGTLGDALWTSLQRVLWGLGFGIAIGATLALASGLAGRVTT